MELGDPEAASIFDDHHRGGGNIDADFDHRGGHQYVDLPRTEPVHHLVFVCGLHLPVEQTHLQTLELPGCQTFGLLGGRGCLDLGGTLDQWTDDIGLPAGRHLVAHPSPGLELLEVAPQPASRDRQPTARHLVEHRHFEVAEDHHRRRARDWGCRHHEQVRITPLSGGSSALLAQSSALFHTEAVLLVDHGET